MTHIAHLPPSDLADLMLREGVRRFSLVWDRGSERVRASHPLVEPLARLMEQDDVDFDQHEGFFVQVAPDTGVLQGACVHRTCRGQGAGGVRYWAYDTVEGYLRDGLRLARGMTHKNALAGLWWGGGKGVMARGTGAGAADRRRVYEEYGEFITSLGGCYVTAEDVGTSVEDMAAIFSRTRFTTCIPPRLGGSGNPSVPTARGVVRGMEAGLAHLGLGDLRGKSVAVQGLGHVGGPLVGMLAEAGVASVVGADVDPACVEAVRQSSPGLHLDLRVVERGDSSVLAAPVDIVSPNATGGILGPTTIPAIRARLVCGAANNQLADDRRDDRLLQDAGVLYLPDFVVNRMGIVHCADEQAGYVDPDPVIERHLGSDWSNSVYRLSLDILARAASEGRTPAAIALELAEARSFDVHPVYGHRGVEVIASLVRRGWADACA